MFGCFVDFDFSIRFLNHFSINSTFYLAEEHLILYQNIPKFRILVNLL